MKNTPILTADLMRQCDDYTIHTLGIPSQVLMERAATGVINYMKTHAKDFPITDGGIFVLCGNGNNGGDGFAVARLLYEEGYRGISVCYGGKLDKNGNPDKKKMSVECARQYEFLYSLPVEILSPAQALPYPDRSDVIIDALFGIGLDRPVEGDLAVIIRAVNASGKPVLAVDIPSGIHGDSGKILGCAVKATATVTMQALKTGLLLYPGADHAGKLHIVDIGVDLTPARDHKFYLADRALLLSSLPPRNRRSHKGTYGQIGLICGSEGMSGAAILSARGASRAGAGLVRVITPECNRIILQVAIPEAIATCYPSSAPAGREVISALNACDGLVIGCGLGITTQSATLLGIALDACPIRPSFPVVLDADALNLLSRHPHLWQSRLLTEGASQVIITPHPVEMARLTGWPISKILQDPFACALGFAQKRGITVVLKDAHTVIASPEEEAYLCPFGNAGMAKGGSGDVLAGIIGALAVQRREDLNKDLSIAKITAAGIALHALAGDLAADELGESGMTPSDLILKLPLVTKDLSDTKTYISQEHL